MIETSFMDYCDGCPYLEPSIDTYWSDGKNCLTTIYCEKQDMCKNIYEHIKTKIEADEYGQG